MSWGLIVVSAVGAGVSMVNASKNRKLAEGQANDAEIAQQESQAKLDKQKAEYKAMTFENPAGTSGIAGLAQSMANQGQIQTQGISASIGMQESQNQKLAAGGAAQVQTAERQGEQFVMQSEQNRQATLLGMQMGETSGVNQANQQAQANQMNAQIAQNQATSDMFGTMANAAGAATSAMGKKKAPTGKQEFERSYNSSTGVTSGGF